jgi:beta-lactam-binding protein with PASTA domain
VTVDGATDTVSILANSPGLCAVQNVKGNTLPLARRTLARAHCPVGKIRRAYSRTRSGRVISQKPKAGTVLRKGGKVDLMISRGRKG